MATNNTNSIPVLSSRTRPEVFFNLSVSCAEGMVALELDGPAIVKAVVVGNLLWLNDRSFKIMAVLPTLDPAIKNVCLQAVG